MRKILEDVVAIPVACETNRYVACFTSMLMCIEKLHAGLDAAMCVKKQSLCTECGDCGETIENTLGAKHERLYNHYLTASGANLQTYAVEETMSYAGYEFDRVDRDAGEQTLRERIVASIDQGRPVPVRIANSAENWDLITGYDDDGAVLFGWDGRDSYWADSSAGRAPEKDGYLADRMFYLRDWYKSTEFALIVTGKTKPRAGNQDVYRRLIAAIEAEKATFDAIVKDLQQEAASTMGIDELNALLAASTGILYNQIDARYMASCSFRTTYYAEAPDGQKPVMSEIARHFLQIHDLSWEVFGALGDKVDVFYHVSQYVEGLRKPEVRKQMAQLIQRISDHNSQAADLLRGIVAQPA